MSIINVLNQIREEEIVLPGIQRDFVWPEEKIVRLLDSIMRGYPIGIALLWETYEDIQYRTFVRDFTPDNLHAYHDNSHHKKLKLVLDGQQRLQSLYVALYGSHRGKSLYFDILSGEDSDDVSDEKFVFSFATPEEIALRHTTVEQYAAKPADQRPEDYAAQQFLKVSDIFSMHPQEKLTLKNRVVDNLSLSDQDEIRLDLNLALFNQALSVDENILKVAVIDENLPAQSPVRKSETDVLEIFVRVNTEGTQLSRSDLIFSMLKLNWKEAAEALPDFVRHINEGNSFDLDNDFVIRCLFAVSDLGTRFNLDVLRKRGNIRKLRHNFASCCDAIRATVDFVQAQCWCGGSKMIGGHNAMVPFVYYFFHADKHQIPNDQVSHARKAFYLFAFARPFSRYAESRLWAFIRSELKPRAEKGDPAFPLERAVWWVNHWERIGGFNEALLQSNHLLTLHAVQGLYGARAQYDRNEPQTDHIFPRSELRKKGYDESLINHFANFWILEKGKNQNKSNRHPAAYFKDVDDSELATALIDRDMLDYRRFTTFVKQRSDAMIEKVSGKLGFSNDDFFVLRRSEGDLDG